MLQTAHGSLTTGLHLRPGQQLLVHCGTSTVGLAAIAIAHQFGAIVSATTRNTARADLLLHVGTDHVVIDDDRLADALRTIAPEGLDASLEFVSATALPAVLSLTLRGGTVCFVGAVSDKWTLPDFSPFTIPNGVSLTSYAGAARDLPAEAPSRYLDAISAGTTKVVIADTYIGLDQIAAAHQDFEFSPRAGKRVVVLPS